MSRIVVAGAGAIGASVAFHLAAAGAEDVVLADRGAAGSGSTGKAMGGVRQQFSTAAEVALARASIRFFEALGPPYFRQVGYLFLATTQQGLAELESRAAMQRELGVPVEEAKLPAEVRTDDVLGAFACWEDGLADPPAVTRELVRRAVELGVSLRENTPAEELEADVLVVAAGPWSAALAAAKGVDLPIRPLCRQLIQTSELDLPEDLPMVVEHESGFHFRRKGRALVLAMPDPAPRWGFDLDIDGSVLQDRLARLAHRYPPAQDVAVARAWAGLYDMTPDAHPIVGRVGEGLFAACGFSGHGFMQSPAVGRALAELILDGRSSFDLSPYALERFEGDSLFPEELVL